MWFSFLMIFTAFMWDAVRMRIQYEQIFFDTFPPVAYLLASFFFMVLFCFVSDF